ncbi:MAG: hypothetical protein PHT40_01100 [Patescibacteria group bacterium]|nr:hypothetical protein [Patescibacteria group bacterium]
MRNNLLSRMFLVVALAMTVFPLQSQILPRRVREQMTADSLEEDKQQFLLNKKRFLVASAQQWCQRNKIEFYEAAKTFPLWNKKAPSSLSLFNYSLATLMWMAEENKKGERWVVYAYTGTSVHDQLWEIGNECASYLPAFLIEIEVTPDSNYLGRRNLTGYYIVNLKPRFKNFNWHEQGAKIKELGPKFKRAELAVFSEINISLYLINKKDDFSRFYLHVAEEEAYEGRHYCLTNHFGKIVIGSISPDETGGLAFFGTSAVFLALKPDFN